MRNDEDESAQAETYARRLRESDELQELLEEAPLSEPGAQEFNPSAAETKEVNIEPTERGITVEIIDVIEPTHDESGYTGYTMNTVTGHFIDDELESVSVLHEYQRGPLYGAGTEFNYEDGEITTKYIWVS